jgi:alkylated DNA repair dioxygenase AlkB
VSRSGGGSATSGTAPLLPPDDFAYTPSLDWDASLPVILARLVAEIGWRQEQISLFGRRHMQPRLICWMGDPYCTYRYSGKSWEPERWHPLVADLRARAEVCADARFNSVLLNYYRDGQDSMGFHSDDERELGDRPVIASLSLGAPRVMHIRHRSDRNIPTQRLLLTDGSLLVMRGNSQRDWKHAIPKSRTASGPRINLTFRLIRFPGSYLSAEQAS